MVMAAVEQFTGMMLHKVYVILTVPVNPFAGVNVYCPFDGFMTIVPLEDEPHVKLGFNALCAPLSFSPALEITGVF